MGFLSHFQLRLEVVRGVDVYYHLAVAREMLESGPLQSFPWTPYSLFAERFADKPNRGSNRGAITRAERVADSWHRRVGD